MPNFTTACICGCNKSFCVAFSKKRLGLGKAQGFNSLGKAQYFCVQKKVAYPFLSILVNIKYRKTA